MTTKKAEFMLYMSEYGLPGDYPYTFRRAGVGFRSRHGEGIRINFFAAKTQLRANPWLVSPLAVRSTGPPLPLRIWSHVITCQFSLPSEIHFGHKCTRLTNIHHRQGASVTISKCSDSHVHSTGASTGPPPSL